jgi:hypothetical protein
MCWAFRHTRLRPPNSLSPLLRRNTRVNKMFTMREHFVSFTPNGFCLVIFIKKLLLPHGARTE